MLGSARAAEKRCQEPVRKCCICRDPVNTTLQAKLRLMAACSRAELPSVVWVSSVLACCNLSFLFTHQSFALLFTGWALHIWDSVPLTALPDPGGEEVIGISKSTDYSYWLKVWLMDKSQKEQYSSILASWGNPSRIRRPCISQPAFLLLWWLLMRAAARPGAKLRLAIRQLIKWDYLFFCISWVCAPIQWPAILRRYDRIYLELYHTIFYGI